MAIGAIQPQSSSGLLVFLLQIGKRRPDGQYPLQVRLLNRISSTRQQQLAHAEVLLHLPERLIQRGAALLEPQSQHEGGDEEEMGAYLARQIFVESVRSYLLESIEHARTQEVPLAISFQIDPPELASLPWEWLTIKGRQSWSPALLDDYGFVRQIERRAARELYGLANPWDLLREAGPLRVLLLTPDEHDAVFIALQGIFHDLIDSHAVQCRTLSSPSGREIARTVASFRPDLIHVLARAEFASSDLPQLFLDKAYTVPEFVALLGQQSPTVLIDGSWRSAGKLAAASSRFAQGLALHKLKGVVAFHSPLSPHESGRFAQAFYRALSEGISLYEAMIAGRQALAQLSDRTVWGLPILFQPSAAIHAAGFKRHARMRRSPLLFAGLIAGVALLLIVSLFVLRDPNHEQMLQASQAQEAEAAGFRMFSFFGPDATPTIDPALLPTPTPHATVLPAPLREPQRWLTYLVEPNDSLESIAAKFSSEAAAIAQINRLEADSLLIPGRGLIVPVYGDAPTGHPGLDVNIGRQDLPLVALTFDIEIDDAMLYQICDLLRARGVQATFFVTGNWVKQYPEEARFLVSEGHELANHSLTHPHFGQISLDGARSEIAQTDQIIIETTGVDPKPFFRFPYGDKNPQVLQILAEEGYISYHWSADDAAIPYWIERVQANPQSGYGAILLMHQRPSTIEGLPAWLDRLQELGFQVVPLSQILK